MVKGTKNIPGKKAAIVQKYISDPYLINGHKFDLRLYVLITNLDPLTVYLYKDGLVRFASKLYSNSTDKLQDKKVHLTNWEINKVEQALAGGFWLQQNAFKLKLVHLKSNQYNITQQS